MISAQPTNVWTLKNCKFRAWSLANQSRAIEFHSADSNRSNVHPIGKVVRTDSDGFVYAEGNMQLPTGCFVAEEAIIEASRDDGHTYPISWIVRSSSPLTQVKAPDGEIDLLNTNEGGLWGENLGRYDGKVYFDDINGSIGTKQIGYQSIINDKLAKDAVATNNIKDHSVTHDKLADDAVGANNIATGVILEKLVGAIGGLLRFRVAEGRFSTDYNNPTKIGKDDFIIILPSPDFLRGTYISTADMENNTFVLLVPKYYSPSEQDGNGFSLFHIDEDAFVSVMNSHDQYVSTSIYARTMFGFIIFKNRLGDVHVCRYLANGNWV